MPPPPPAPPKPGQLLQAKKAFVQHEPTLNEIYALMNSRVQKNNVDRTANPPFNLTTYQSGRDDVSQAATVQQEVTDFTNLRRVLKHKAQELEQLLTLATRAGGVKLPKMQIVNGKFVPVNSNDQALQRHPDHNKALRLFANIGGVPGTPVFKSWRTKHMKELNDVNHVLEQLETIIRYLQAHARNALLYQDVATPVPYLFRIPVQRLKGELEYYQAYIAKLSPQPTASPLVASALQLELEKVKNTLRTTMTERDMAQAEAAAIKHMISSSASLTNVFNTQSSQIGVGFNGRTLPNVKDVQTQTEVKEVVKAIETAQDSGTVERRIRRATARYGPQVVLTSLVLLGMLTQQKPLQLHNVAKKEDKEQPVLQGPQLLLAPDMSRDTHVAKYMPPNNSVEHEPATVHRVQGSANQSSTGGFMHPFAAAVAVGAIGLAYKYGRGGRGKQDVDHQEQLFAARKTRRGARELKSLMNSHQTPQLRSGRRRQ